MAAPPADAAATAPSPWLAIVLALISGVVTIAAVALPRLLPDKSQPKPTEPTPGPPAVEQSRVDPALSIVQDMVKDLQDQRDRLQAERDELRDELDQRRKRGAR